MCMEDINIDRQIKTRATISTDGGAVVVPGDPARLGVRIVADDGAIARLSYRRTVVGSGNSLWVLFQRNANGAFSIRTDRLADIGDALKGELLFESTGGNSFLTETYLEVMTPAPLNQQQLAKG